MIYLIFSILVSSLLYVVFKLFKQFKVNTLHAIICNYYIAFLFGITMSDSQMTVDEVISASWIWGTLVLGVLFIVIFNIMGITAQRSGVAVTSVATKMSVVIPVVFGIVVYDETESIFKIIGIVLALLAVYLTSVKSKEGFKWRNILYPILLFLGSGVIDTSLKYLETNFVPVNQIEVFSTLIFGFAGLFGSLYILLKSDVKIQWKSVIGGVALGIPNYYSIVFILNALATEGLESSTVFTVNNVSIVMFSTILGLIIFKERLLPKNWIGIGLAILSIILVIYT